MALQSSAASSASHLYRRAQAVLDVVSPHAAPNDAAVLDSGAVPYFSWSVSTADNATSSSSTLNALKRKTPSAIQRLCRNKEGWGPVSQFRDLDLTPCAADAYLLAAPSLFFACFAAADLARTSRLPARALSQRSKHVLIAKQALLGLLLAAQIATAVLDGLYGAWLSMQVIASVVQAATYAVLLPLVSHNHLRKRRGSTSALLYLLFHIFAQAARLRTIVIGEAASLQHVIPRAAIVALVVLLFGLECVGPSIGASPKLPLDDDSLAANESAISNLSQEEVQAFNEKRECPEVTANIFSRLAFWWMNPMMSLGAKKTLKEDDMWSLPPGEDAEGLGLRFEHYYAKLRTKEGKPRFWTALGAAFGGPYALAAILKAAQDTLAFAQPQLLRYLLTFVQSYGTESGAPASHGFAISLAIFVVAVVQTAFLHQYFQRCFLTGMRVRAGLVSAIFKKSLRMSNEDRAGKSTGETINIMSVDATRLQDLMTYGHIIWSAFFQMTLAFVSLYKLLGWPSLVGVSVMVVSVPLNTLLARYMRTLSTKQMKIRDRRTKFMSEILNNIKSIKLFAWEEAFTAKLHQIRNVEELGLLRWAGAVSSLFQFVWTAVPFIVSLATFATYSATQSTPLTADLIFPALSLYQLLSFPLAMAAGIISAALQATVSAKRICEFLDAGELDPHARLLTLPDQAEQLIPAAEAKKGEPLVTIREGEFKWSRKQPTPTLQDIDLTVGKGELLAVLGRVGDGKSSLLSCVLGEMYRSDGQVTVRGRTAYFTQGGWCMGTSIKDNILWGLRYEPDFYKRVVAACALEPDFAVLPEGDETEVGEKGVSLSGGQKARVALARAVYARADIYLLDDPLAAVDAHVGAHIFKHVIGPEGLLKTKCRILTTNSVTFLPFVDQIISLRRGTIMEERGSYDEVMEKRGELFTLISSLGKQSQRQRDAAKADERAHQVNEEGQNGKVEASDAGESVDPTKINDKLLRRMSNASIARPAALTPAQIKRETVRSLRESTKPQENRAEGAVSWSVYKNYASSASLVGVGLYSLAQVLTQVLQVGRDVVLKVWAGHPGEDKYYLTLYAVLGFGGAAAVSLAPLILTTWLVIASSRRLHDDLFHAVLRAPLQWFESTPTGRVLNLFSRDTNTIDEVLPRVISGAFRTLMVAFGVICVVVYSVPLFVLAVVPLGWFYVQVMKYYLATSRELKRLDAVSKSPIFTWFQESLGGLSTIRAFGQETRFIATSEARVDRNQECYFPAVSCNRWLAVRIEFIGSTIILLSSMLAVWLCTSGKGKMDAGLMGLMLSQVLNTTQTLNWLVRSLSEVEQNIVSVERILSYSEVECEAPYTVSEDQQPPADWPQRGEIQLKDYSTRYKPSLPLVLKKLDLTIKPGEKIGVVGRTGAGKSSLTLALFRIIEAAEGGIWIDDVDCRSIGLRDLRRALAIIPQDPQLWEGTLRDNLDPTGEADDVALWKALDQARLKDHINSLEGRLDTHLTEGASNFSAGQRQLICIARALLRNAKILLLDEATSAIDIATDELIQKLMRTETKGVTMITIAHRINTVIDADRILVLKDGQIAEFDKPQTLLANKQSIFFDMCREAGLAQVDAQNDK
ncbi:putative YCF1 [Ceraceosorus guamensis]|uniref:Putative YCF1 n=1 Tax=Ceraceosorus guamensis TaxID=1522189 RepID=A0A316VZG4_9BASI|nr:putative YCF1 [Ceraceosorus guamensis]PWN42694.1 putative YCF1 [Ceraceosorus guamensis]